ncbi:translation initiation factor IF-2 [bacterium]|nr:translation initiation factor IF-2 [bacterium]
MAKTVINLVRELGVKSTAEVLELLRRVGVDTAAEGFGVMSKVDDETIAKIRALQAGGTEPEPPKTRRRVKEEEPLEIELKQKPARRRATKDFFGTRKKDEPEPEPSAEEEEETAAVLQKAEPEELPEKPEPKPEPKKKIVKPKLETRPKAQPVEPKKKPGEKIDLSGGPRIISMPDPEETQRLRQQSQPGTVTQVDAPSTPSKKKKKKTAARQTEQARDAAGGRRKKIKEIGGRIDENQRVRSRKRVFKVAGQIAPDQPAVVPHIKIAGPMSLREVAKTTGIKVSEIVRFLMNDLQIRSGINYVASVDEIQLIAENFEIKYTVALDQEPEGELQQFETVDEERLVGRPPVVTVMGHVDHGKTKLLDAIRRANVVDSEAGGITQHIGAYQTVRKGKHITFIDTPGHEAFTAMRARGSQVTDIVILVVAADDGVMPQTIEAINHAKAAEVPIIVAVNKCDKADANPERARNQLSEHGLVPEAWGGDTVFVNISALKGEGIDELLEMILLTAELTDPKADPKAPPCGVVIESQVDTGIGVVATVLVQQGELAKGQFILSGTTIGRIKRMEDYLGQEVQSAGPARPVRVIGFHEPPENGDKVYSFKNKKQAQAIADQRIAKQRVSAAAGASGRMSLEAFFKKAEEGEVKDLNLVVKADVGGSAEALVDSLKKIDVEGAKCHVVASGVGQINDTDINLAAASNAVIIGFGVGMSTTAKKLVEREHVDVRLYDIIYEVTEDIELAMKGLLEPVYEEQALGRVEIRAIFKQDKNGSVCGCYVLDGLAKRGAKYRLKRGKDTVLTEMTLHSLKRFKDDVREVASGFECGLLVENRDVEEGDILELYEIVEKSRN